MKKKALSHYLDLMKSAQDKKDWNTFEITFLLTNDISII
jgi:hypothetical protein